MVDTVRGRHHSARGALRLACFVALAPFVPPRRNSRVGQEHPGLRVKIIETDMEGAVEMLLSGSLEAAIADNFGGVYDLTFDHLYSPEPHGPVRR